MSINSSIGSSDRGPTGTPSTVQTEHRFHDSECSSQADPRQVSPPALASRSAFQSPVPSLKKTNTMGGEAFDETSKGDDKERDDVNTIPSNAICLELSKDKVI